MWEFVKSHEAELLIKGCVVFLKRVTRSFRYGPNHSVTKITTNSSLEKGLNFVFSLVSAVHLIF